MDKNDPESIVPGVGGSKSSKSKVKKIYGIRDQDFPYPDDPEDCLRELGINFDKELEDNWEELQANLNKNQASSKTTIINQSSSSESAAVDLLTFDKILSTIGFLGLDELQYREMFQSFPLVKNDDDGKSLTNEEINLGNTYKCDTYHHQCYFTTDCPKSFEKHLEQKHPNQSLYCFYCTKTNENHNCKKGDSFAYPARLWEHIKYTHSLNLKYQCNLCYYRAFTPDHIFIHQAYEHSDLFLKTIAKQARQNPAEEDGEEVKKTCKIIFCPCPDDTMPILSEDFFLQKYGSKLKPANGGNQCIYCNESYKNDELLNHFVAKHPEFPILSELNGKVASHPLERPAAMIDHFIERLRTTTVKPTYDDKTMKAAFQAYGGNDQQKDGADSSQQQKGTKRKQSDDGDGDGEDHPVDPPANQDEMDSTSTTDPPASKRRPKGLFGGYVSVPTWNQTKAAVGMATTAIFALGFYKFAHYLPLTIKKLTE